MTTEPMTLEFWYDFSSPFSYLGATQVDALAARANARLVWRPMLLGALFKDVGTPNVPYLAAPPAKQRYLARDMGYWAAYWQVPFRFTSRFPMKTVTALRLALQAGDKIGPLSLALFRALWVHDQDLNDEATLRAVLAETGLDPDALLAGTQDPAVKQRLFAATSEASSLGIFGAPTFVVKHPEGDLLFWGQDRIPMVEKALGGWRPPVG